MIFIEVICFHTVSAQGQVNVSITGNYQMRSFAYVHYWGMFNFLKQFAVMIS